MQLQRNATAIKWQVDQLREAVCIIRLDLASEYETMRLSRDATGLARLAARAIEVSGL